MAKRVRKIDLLKVLFRSFYLEASWNFERLQNIGFVYALMPVAWRLYPEREDRKAFMDRHLKFFNTNPIMSTFIMGVVINMEERMRLGEKVTPGDIDNVKNSMMGPLAAIGDNLFWEYMRPFSATIGIVIIMLAGSNQYLALVGPLVALVLYNTLGFYVRTLGVFKGYEMGVDIISYLKNLELRWLSEKISLLSVLILGSAFPVIFFFGGSNLLGLPAGLHFTQSIAFFLLTLLVVVALRIKITPTVLFYGMIIASILLAQVI
jgi:PTS system mannose-specific IID component